LATLPSGKTGHECKVGIEGVVKWAFVPAVLVIYIWQFFFKPQMCASCKIKCLKMLVEFCIPN
jgi:hypothetical protein